MSLQELQDQMEVLAAIQLRQTQVQKLQAEELDAIRTYNAETRRALEQARATHDQRMQEWDERINKLVSGFGAFLRTVTGPQP